jgi:hypothetical protein
VPTTFSDADECTFAIGNRSSKQVQRYQDNNRRAAQENGGRVRFLAAAQARPLGRLTSALCRAACAAQRAKGVGQQRAVRAHRLHNQRHSLRLLPSTGTKGFR